MPNNYIPSLVEGTSEDFGYTVRMYYAEGSAPNYCQFTPHIGDTPNGTYKLLKIDEKYVSEFSNVTLYCENDADSVVVEGYLIWDEE